MKTTAAYYVTLALSLNLISASQTSTSPAATGLQDTGEHIRRSGFVRASIADDVAREGIIAIS